jgi:hypothetical protein
VFFSVAWVGHLMLADVGLFGGQVTRSALGGGALTVVLFIFVGLLYAAHVAYVRRRVGIDETPEIHADSGIGSVIGAIFFGASVCPDRLGFGAGSGRPRPAVNQWAGHRHRGGPMQVFVSIVLQWQNDNGRVFVSETRGGPKV